MKRLVNQEELLDEHVRIKRRQLRDFRARGIVPFVKINSKTILYDPDKVLAALEKYERKAVTRGGKIVKEAAI
jgi:hypothetical protein